LAISLVVLPAAIQCRTLVPPRRVVPQPSCRDVRRSDFDEERNFARPRLVFFAAERTANGDHGFSIKRGALRCDRRQMRSHRVYLPCGSRAATCRKLPKQPPRTGARRMNFAATQQRDSVRRRGLRSLVSRMIVAPPPVNRKLQNEVPEQLLAVSAGKCNLYGEKCARLFNPYRTPKLPRIA